MSGHSGRPSRWLAEWCRGKQSSALSFSSLGCQDPCRLHSGTIAIASISTFNPFPKPTWTRVEAGGAEVFR